MYNGGGSATITNCTFSDNGGDVVGGGGIYNDNCSVAMSNCTFSNNTVLGEVGGGGIYNYESSGFITNSTFSGNYASQGGGIHNRDSDDVTIINSTFNGNIIADGGGGGIYNKDSSVTIINCTFSGNIADYGDGGGIYNARSSPTITNCTFNGNSATKHDSPFDFGYGGGIYNWDSSPAITNSILWGDTAASGGPGIYNYGSFSPTVRYCNIDQDGFAGSDGNIRIDPRFVDPGSGDFHLQGGSPCIDAGTESATALPATDFEGEVRKAGVTVDIGADEFVDTDGDGIPDRIEETAPNGDGNSDGTPDSQQAHVSSLPNAVDGRYVTLASPDGTSLFGVSAVEPPADAPAWVDLPYGLFQFTVNDVTPGGATSVTVILPDGEAPASYVKHDSDDPDPATAWYEFMFDGTTGAVISGNTITLHLVDGARGDHDGDGTNGTIVEPGGPAIVSIFVDVTSSCELSQSRMMFNRRTGEQAADVTLKNISSGPLQIPLKVVIRNISDRSVTCANEDGTYEGDPYFEYTTGTGVLMPGETCTRRWIFHNPSRRRFGYDAVVYGQSP